MGFSYVLTLSTLLVLAAKFSLQQQCRSRSDLGQTECVLLTPYYSVYQWATCLTNDYIMLVSNRTHLCRSTTATQCYYQCMLEIYGVDEGPVYNDCSCRLGQFLPNNVNVLPAECYSPRGDDCGWYGNCLERRYGCSGTDDGYAIEFARRFCNVYVDNYNDFSSLGRLWIDRVRKCLQVSLVPALRLWVTTSCADIRRVALSNHSNCYTNGFPSICQLSCADVWRAFVIVNFPGGNLKEGALVTTPISTIDQMLSVMRQCNTNKELPSCIRNLFTTLRIGVRITGRIDYIFRTPTTAYVVARHFARALSWERNGIRWFPLFNQITDEEIYVMVLLVDTKLLNIRSLQFSGQNLNQAISSLVNAIKSGSLSRIPLNINNTEVTSSLSSVNQCVDIDCNSASLTLLVVPDSECGTEMVSLHYLAFYTVFAVVLLMM